MPTIGSITFTIDGVDLGTLGATVATLRIEGREAERYEWDADARGWRRVDWYVGEVNEIARRALDNGKA